MSKEDKVTFSQAAFIQEYWSPTQLLRWRIDTFSCEKVLQQMWSSSIGNTEWRDIKVINEP